MNVKVLLPMLALFGMSCSDIESQVTLTAVTSTSSTSTTIGKGSDCTASLAGEIWNRLEGLGSVQGNTEGQILKQMAFIREFRLYVRGLDVPRVSREQAALVDSLENYHNALNRYVQSQGSDSSANSEQISMVDAYDDFTKAVDLHCRVLP